MRASTRQPIVRHSMTLVVCWICSIALCRGIDSNTPIPRVDRPDPPSKSEVAPSTSTNSLPDSDPKAFRIVSERNIFNPGRSSRAVRSEGESRKPSKVEVLTLVGTLAYEKGTFAFFEGTSGEYKKVLQKDARIAGFQVAEILSNEVKLVGDDKTHSLQVGGQLRRRDEGPWEPGEPGAALPVAPAASTGAETPSDAAAAPAAGGGNDILERLRRKREQEMKK